MRKTFWLLRQRWSRFCLCVCSCHVYSVPLTWEVTSNGPKDIFLAGAPELIFAFVVWWRAVLTGCFHRCLNILFEFI